ncbi:hypothetical protein DICPUDRAFT_146505 [Dictyostelium purpureum]|uniref:BRCT domain-containing protein n=1 Tax=Dictyostelium purpureum TaxID=5786 RepID=F0Z652_DICPU|nr:uncharacterized protein DICPUDRAFT_146505 [Dictyostelium purpureum]EGC40594.1 hypothetical protein DICPUDRAFT_146505 [Dictyostelium purpureum]|eukprot:XP_003282930.1 hypothetical protein DICPUDRAFT_146505 [Dictyostelium purpureum]
MSHTHTHGWYWLDDNAWIPYDKKLIDNFEKSFNSTNFLPGNKKISVDQQRFIEIMPLKDVISNFVNVAHDPDIVGMQRRYDDPMKRRVVKRSSLQTITFFDNLEFSFYSTAQKTKTQEIKDIVKMCGGKFVDDFTKKTDYLIVKPNDLKDAVTTFNTIIAKAENLKVVPVESTWIDSCVKAKKLVDHTTYVVAQKPVPVVAAATATSTSSASAASTSPSNTKNTKSKSTTGATTSNTLKPYVENLIKGSEWTGVCSTDDDHYPFIMTVDNVDGNDEVSGTITWINLGSAKTKYKGKLNRATGEFNFEEYEVITGEDEVEVPNSYTSVVYGDEIIGKITDSTFKLKLTKSPPVTHMQPDSKWNGTSRQPENFKLEITKRENADIMGKITWSSYDAFGTFKGTVTPTHIDVSEYKETSKNPGPELTHPFKLVPIITQNKQSSNGTTITTTKTSFKIEKN